MNISMLTRAFIKTTYVVMLDAECSFFLNSFESSRKTQHACVTIPRKHKIACSVHRIKDVVKDGNL